MMPKAVIRQVSAAVKTGGMTEMRTMPNVGPQFKSDVACARKKATSYAKCATVLVEDLTSWGLHEPNIEQLLFGTQAVHIDAVTLEPVAVVWKDREVHLSQNRGIGPYIFLRADRLIIYHNLMANNYKIMPLEHMRRCPKGGHEQFMFVNMPGGPR